METRGHVDTAENQEQASVAASVMNQSLLSGALKSGQSQRPDKNKRASAVRFADQINNIDQEENNARKSQQASEHSGASGKAPSRVSGMQIVGSQEIEADDVGKNPIMPSDDTSREPTDGVPPRDRSRLTEDNDSVNRGGNATSDGSDEEDDDEVNSVAMRQKASQMTIDTTTPADEEKNALGDQKIVDVDYGPLYDMKILVDEKVFLSQISDLGARPEDCTEFVIEFLRAKDNQQVKLPNKQKPMPADFTRAERNLVHVSLKKVIGQKRVILRVIQSVLENPKYARFRKVVIEYQKKIKEELITDCNYFTDMLHSYCVDRTGNGPESETFFLTMIGDLTRYCAEQTPAGPKLKDLKESAQSSYKRAGRKATRLHYCSPTKMSLDLHHANFEHEFMSNTEKAIKICEQSVLMAQAMLHTVDEDTYVETTHLQELLKENVAIWRGQDPSSVNQNGFD